jgi:uncharacterized protein YndB with AHSA1/START domain
MHEPHEDIGRLEEADGRWRLSYIRNLPHPPEKVWRALTEAEHVSRWFPCDIHGEWAPGSPLRFTFREHEAEDFAGEVITADPPKTLEFTWGGDTLRFELEPDGERTVLRFFDTIDELGKAARDGGGWHACLDVLEYELSGDEPPWSANDHWRDVEPLYLDSFPPEATTVGPPDSHRESKRD